MLFVRGVYQLGLTASACSLSGGHRAFFLLKQGLNNSKRVLGYIALV